ncbi:MAG: SDR family NAD(P)-dependent oxidoreductase [Sneathiella sp.]|uniref:SDR family NAD(P)-dependent oxidoreductase n=1 Tax=Sneathiella sp. TaxID=1964365 RepID=UPI0030011BAA
MTSKIVWIVGASSGIGKELARQYAQKGVTVLASARRLNKLEELTNEFPNQISAVQLDVTDTDSIQNATERVFNCDNMPDTIILNAGIYQPMSHTHFVAQNAEEAMMVNYLGVVRMIEPILPRLVNANRGKIVVVGSVAGYNGLPLSLAYGPTKAALINLCEALYIELIGSGVSVQLVSPGFVKTPLTEKNKFPMPFLLDVSDAAERILKGIDKGKFEIVLPRRFAYLLKIIRMLPYTVSLPLLRKLTGS